MQKKFYSQYVVFLLLFTLIGCAENTTMVALQTPISLSTSTPTEQAVISTSPAISTQTPILIPSASASPQLIFQGRIALIGPTRTDKSIRILDLENGNEQGVTGMGYGSLSWSSDSQWIAFNGGKSLSQQTDIYIIRPDGSDLKQLTNSSQGKSDLDWSPDGKSLVYTYDDHVQPSDLAVISVDHNTSLLLTTTKGYESHPAWSPDGKQIAYLYADHMNSPLELWIMDSDGKHSKLLVDYPIAFSRMSWSPDGKWIAFVSGETSEDCGDIYIVRSNGSDLTQLTNLFNCATTLVWSPDGENIAFIARDRTDRKGWQIHIMNVTSENVVAITQESELSIYDIDWTKK